jgi:hypothetical protein
MIHSFKIDTDFSIDLRDFLPKMGLQDVLSYRHQDTPIRSMPRINAWGRQSPTRVEGLWGRTIPLSHKPKEVKIEKSHPIFDNASTSKSSIQDIFSKVFAHDMSHSN